MDDKQLEGEKKLIRNVVGHEAWPILRKSLTDKILELQNVAEVADILEAGDAQKLVIELKANKKACEVLFTWLREIEGTAQEPQGTTTIRSTFIYEEK